MNGERGALDRLEERLADALRNRGEVLEAYLFGSEATGRTHPDSDIDVAVFVDPQTAPDDGFGYRAGLTADLMAHLRSNRVDVVVLNDAPPLLYHRVLRDGVRLLSRDLKATTVREARAVSRYCDFLPQLAKIDAIRSPRSISGDSG